MDFTGEMIAKARENQEKLQYQNISFIKGDIEDLPVKDNIVDVAISNCTMNLVPNKSKAYQEVFRVLKKGGHFSISDIVLGKSLPEHIRKDAEIYAGCISGAQLQDEYLETIRNAGFCSVEIKTVSNIHLPEKLLEKHLSGQELNSWNKKDAIKSITVYGEK